MDDIILGSSLNRSNHLLQRLGGASPRVSSLPISISSSGLKQMGERYLSTTAMRATANSMALVSSVLGFDIVEIWTELEANGKLHCTYVHADESVTSKYPEIIAGHFPEHKKEHILSPKLCELAKKSSQRYHWRVIENRVYDPSTAGTVYDQLKFPLRTEMAYQLEHRENDQKASAFIVAFSFEKISFKPYKLKFLSGLAVAIFVAAFDLEDEEQNGLERPRRLSIEEEKELDNKEFAPAHSYSSVNLAGLPAPGTSLGSSGSGVALALPLPPSGSSGVMPPPVPSLDFSRLHDTVNYRRPSLLTEELNYQSARRSRATSMSDGIAAASGLPPSGRNRSSSQGYAVGLDLSQSDGVVLHPETDPSKLSPTQAPLRLALSPRALELPPLEISVNPSTPRDILDETLPTPRSLISVTSRTDLATGGAVVPAWEPAASFNYPVFQIPIKYVLPNDLTMESFYEVKHIADGSNSNIFLAKFQGQRVIIKMIKQVAEHDSVAIQEFDLEYGTLARVSHPHIIRIIGAGSFPRRFIVLEWLGGGTLNTVLAENQQAVGLAQKFFRKPTFTYTSLLQNAKSIAEALEYLHHRCHPGATIIHRDLKPDNVGYTKDGHVKLFDFGLSTCVKSRTKTDEAYEMTGYTGSLRYMAPEVVLRKPYSEKADIFSFGIMLWQMASDKVPFKGFSKDEFVSQVVYQGLRPKLDRSWPNAFNQLLKQCWDHNPINRPSFTIVVMELNKLLAQETGSGGGGGSSLKSSWF